MKSDGDFGGGWMEAAVAVVVALLSGDPIGWYHVHMLARLQCGTDPSLCQYLIIVYLILYLVAYLYVNCHRVAIVFCSLWSRPRSVVLLYSNQKIL